jgi:hypothetical protein
MSPVRFNARLETSRHPFKDAEVAVDSLTGIHTAIVKHLFVVNRSYITRNFRGRYSKTPEDASKANVEDTQWINLYESIRHDRHYRDHIAHHGSNVPEHHNAFTASFQL